MQAMAILGGELCQEPAEGQGCALDRRAAPSAFPKVTAPAAPPIRPERYVANSFATMRRTDALVTRYCKRLHKRADQILDVHRIVAELITRRFKLAVNAGEIFQRLPRSRLTRASFKWSELQIKDRAR